MGRTLITAIGRDSPADAGWCHGRRGLSFLGQPAGSPVLPPNLRQCVSEVPPQLWPPTRSSIYRFRLATVRLAALAPRRTRAIIGTTGTSAEDDAKIAEAAKKTAIMVRTMIPRRQSAPVMTRKVVPLLSARNATSRLSEMPHNRRSIRRSCTALLSGEALRPRAADRISRRTPTRPRRHTGARKPGNIGSASLRGAMSRRSQRGIFSGAD